MSETPNWQGPNTNTLSERLAAAHKRNVEKVQAPAPVVAAPAPAVSDAKRIAYQAGVTALEPLILRIEELERKMAFLEKCLVNAAAPKI